MKKYNFINRLETNKSVQIINTMRRKYELKYIGSVLNNE
jgi:hypothetical protein